MDAYNRCPGLNPIPTPPRRQSIPGRIRRAILGPLGAIADAASGLKSGAERSAPRDGARRKRRPSAATRERQTLEFQEAVVGIVILILAVISGVWTFEGAYLQNQRVGGDTVNVLIYATLIAIGVTAAQVTAWWVLVSVIPRLKSGRTLLLGVGLTAALQGWTWAVSSLNNAVALTGGPAIVRSLEDQSAAYARAVETATANALAVKPYLGLLEGEAEARCNLSEAERQDGAVTGAGGPGAVSATLAVLCNQSRANANLMRDVVGSTERRAREIQTTLSQMDTVIYDEDLSVFARETAFIELVGDVAAWLRQTRSDDLTEALRTSHQVMASSITTLPTTDDALGRRQAAVIAGLKTSVSETGKLYQQVGAKLDAMPEAAAPPPAQRVSVVEAVWDSAPHHLPSVAAALGIDTFNITILLAFILARETMRKKTAPATARHPPQPRKPKEQSP